MLCHKKVNMLVTQFIRTSTSAVDSDQLEQGQQGVLGSKNLAGGDGGGILAAGTTSMMKMIRRVRLFCHRRLVIWND